MATNPDENVEALRSLARYQEHVPGETVVESRSAAWADLELRGHVFPGTNEGTPAPAIPQHTLTFVYGGDIEGARRTGGGPWNHFDTRTDGHVTLRPAGRSTSLRWRTTHPVRTLSLYLVPDRLEELGLRMGMAPARIELRDRFNLDDPVLRRISERLRRRAMQDGSADRLFIQTALQVLSERLLRQHSVTSPPESDAAGRLSRGRLYRVQRYVRAHLDADLSLDDLAQEVGLSKYHFSRRFRRRTGQPPYQFVIYERIRAARRTLRETTRPLAQIALMVGFSSQSHFTRTFKRHVGVPPGKYRAAWR